MRKQGKYTNATVLLWHELLIPHLVPIVPGAVLVVAFYPRIGEAAAAGGTSRLLTTVHQYTKGRPAYIRYDRKKNSATTILHTNGNRT